MTFSPIDIEIKTVNLKNRKLTKAIFNQIEYKSCFDKNLNFIGNKYFGYIRDKDKRYLLWSIDQELRKTDLSGYTLLYKLSDNGDSLNWNYEWFLKKTQIEYAEHTYSGKVRLELEAEQCVRYNNLFEKVKIFIDEIMKHQMFI